MIKIRFNQDGIILFLVINMYQYFKKFKYPDIEDIHPELGLIKVPACRFSADYDKKFERTYWNRVPDSVRGYVQVSENDDKAAHGTTYSEITYIKGQWYMRTVAENNNYSVKGAPRLIPYEEGSAIWQEIRRLVMEKDNQLRRLAITQPDKYKHPAVTKVIAKIKRERRKREKAQKILQQEIKGEAQQASQT